MHQERGSEISADESFWSAPWQTSVNREFGRTQLTPEGIEGTGMTEQEITLLENGYFELRSPLSERLAPMAQGAMGLFEWRLVVSLRRSGNAAHLSSGRQVSLQAVQRRRGIFA